jgi:hypothetical protein
MITKKNKNNKTENKNIYKMIDLCCGTGAFSLAFENTGKVKTIFANDFDKNSKLIYDDNFDLKLTLKDIHDIDTKKDIETFDILTAGFPCFVAGTKVLTNDGYKNIEDINLDDKLITHKQKCENILNLQRKMYNGELYSYDIKYHPENIICTKEHPFYVREQIKIWNNTKRNYDYFWKKPVWKKANEITLNDYFGMPINSKNVIPKFTFEKKINNTLVEKVALELNNKDFWYMMGYFVGDGWIEETKKKDG